MTEPTHAKFSIRQLAPNLLTVTAICFGLTAIQMSVAGRVQAAVLLVLAAALLDGLDGKVARMLKSDSKMGAELDSLADFLNFGVTPALMLYYWGLQGNTSIGWSAVLVYAVCCVIRLARFNVATKSDVDNSKSGYFVGVPSPAGAMLVMLPLFVDFAFATGPISPYGVSIYMMVIGLLLISRIPTWSLKSLKISRENVKYVLVGFVILGASLYNYPWETMIFICAAYVCIVIWTLLTKRHLQF